MFENGLFNGAIEAAQGLKKAVGELDILQRVQEVYERGFDSGKATSNSESFTAGMRHGREKYEGHCAECGDELGKEAHPLHGFIRDHEQAVRDIIDYKDELVRAIYLEHEKDSEAQVALMAVLDRLNEIAPKSKFGDYR